MTGQKSRQTYEWRKKHQNGKSKITEFNVHWIPTAEIIRPAPSSVKVDQVAAFQKGVRRLFSFCATATGVLRSRVFSCWCTACCVCGNTTDGVGQVADCASEEKWSEQTLRKRDNVGVRAQNKATEQNARGICSCIKEGQFVALETVDDIVVEGAVNSERFYICRIMRWDDDDTDLQRKETRSRGTVGGKLNQQPVKKGDPLYRASYFKIDTADPSGLTFVDSGCISVVSGLGFRRILAEGAFQPKPSAAAAAAGLRVRSLRSGGARVDVPESAAGSTVPRWMQWELQLDEKLSICKAISEPEAHSTVPS
jgi:hypothetical protein